MGANAHATGFADPGHGSQIVVRALMDAMAQPGTIRDLDVTSGRCPGFSPAMTLVALTLADFETPLWLDVDPGGAGDYLRFHTGARLVADPAAAAFAFVSRPAVMPPLSHFAQGTLEYPDTSTTIVMNVASLDATRGWRLTGPGIDGVARLKVSPDRAGLPEELSANRAGFPLGVDLILCAGSRLAALPRSTRVSATEGAR